MSIFTVKIIFHEKLSILILKFNTEHFIQFLLPLCCFDITQSHVFYCIDYFILVSMQRNEEQIILQLNKNNTVNLNVIIDALGT